MKIIQIAESLSLGDAIANDVVAIDKLLKNSGIKCEIYATNANNIDKKYLHSIAEPVELLSGVDDEDIILLTKNGVGIRFNSSQISPTGRTTVGVKGINLNEGDFVVSALCRRDTNDKLGIFSTIGTGKRINVEELPVQTRGGKGLSVYRCGGSSGNIVGASLISEGDFILIAGINNSICIAATDLPLLTRTSFGNIMVKSNISSVVKI